MATMKAGTDTGSLINHLYSRATEGAPEPEIGMGATVLSWSDRHAATVVGWDGKVVSVQRDRAVRVDANGMSESQTYEFSPDLEGVVDHFRRDKNGSWDRVTKNRETGRWNKTSNGGLILGVRHHYHDFSF